MTEVQHLALHVLYSAFRWPSRRTESRPGLAVPQVSAGLLDLSALFRQNALSNRAAGSVEVLRLAAHDYAFADRSGFTSMFEDSMKKLAQLSIGPGLTCCLLTFLSSPGVLSGQTTNLLSSEPGKAGEPLNWTTQQDHQNMMDQLGIIRLRP